MANSNLRKAKKAKNDEFYTRLTDIEKELKHYKQHFNGKIVFCNCDDPESSDFWKYFSLNFDYLGLKKLISTHFEREKPSYKLEMVSVKKKPKKTKLKGNGDFRSDESIAILKKCDIVVTNPPFSLFREYVAQLVEYDKKFLIIGNMNAITNKEIFKLIKNNQLWLGNNAVHNFIQPDGTTKKFGNINWYTNLTHSKRNEDIILFREYNADDYPTYDNYDAINVDKTKDIPMDYDGVMGVPVSFMTKWNPEQFEIIWQASGNTRASAPIDTLNQLKYQRHPEDRGGCGIIINKRKYSRIFIRNKRLQGNKK